MVPTKKLARVQGGIGERDRQRGKSWGRGHFLSSKEGRSTEEGGRRRDFTWDPKKEEKKKNYLVQKKLRGKKNTEGHRAPGNGRLTKREKRFPLIPRGKTEDLWAPGKERGSTLNTAGKGTP